MAGVIVVALDGSALSEEAVPVAARLAGERDAALALLRVVPTSHPPIAEYPAMPLVENPWDSPAMPAAQTPPDPEAEDRAQAGRYLEGVAAHLQGPTRLMVREGRAAEEIVAAARDAGAEFIVMTTHGRRGLARMVMGSVADAVVRTSPVPVVLMRPHRIAAAQAGDAGRASPVP